MQKGKNLQHLDSQLFPTDGADDIITNDYISTLISEGLLKAQVSSIKPRLRSSSGLPSHDTKCHLHPLHRFLPTFLEGSAQTLDCSLLQSGVLPTTTSWYAGFKWSLETGDRATISLPFLLYHIIDQKGTIHTCYNMNKGFI